MKREDLKEGMKCFYEGQVVRIKHISVDGDTAYVKFKSTKEESHVFVSELKPYIKPSRLLEIAESAIQGLIIDDKESAHKYLLEQVELYLSDFFNISIW